MAPKLEETFFETSKPEKLSFETSKLNTLIIVERFHHISQRILSNLDHESHLRFRLVCQSWNKTVDNPFFWIKKCKNTGQQPEELHFAWIELLQKIEENDLPDEDFKECLMKWYGKLPTSYYLRHVGEGNIFGKKTTRRIIQKVDEEMLPMHVIAEFGILSLLEISSLLDNLNQMNAIGMAPIHYAARFGNIEIVKFLAPKIKSLNEPISSSGYTPICLAARCGHINVTKFLISRVKNPNASIHLRLYPNERGRVAYWTDMTPLELAKHFGHQETVDFFEQY